MGKLKVLITGASGFIGSRFLELNRSLYELIPVSLRETSPSELNCSAYDVVLHLAGLAHQMEEVDEKEYFRINKDLSLDLANKAKSDGVKHFIYISTTKVYGDGDENEVYAEDSVCKPTDPYGQSKLDAELALKELSSADFKIAIVRPPLVYGAGVKGNLLRFIKLAKLPIPLPFKGVSNNRAMVYVDNLIALIDRIIENEAVGVYTLTDVDHISTEMLISEIRHDLGRRSGLIKPPLFFLRALKRFKPELYSRLYGSFNVNCDYTLSTLKYTNPISFRQGIHAMVSHYQKRN